MDITVENLKRERDEAASVAYQSFVLLTSSNSNSLFCFFENKDAPYYHPRIKSNYFGNYHYISCGNKSMVLKTYELIKNHIEYEKFKLAFFVDRDYDFSIKNKYPQIYETPCYSIENLYCSVNVFKEFLKVEFQMGEEDILHTRILELYRKLQNDFFKASILFNAWYKLQKRLANKKNVKISINLSNSLSPHFIQISLSEIKCTYDLRTINNKYPGCMPFKIKELIREILILKKSNLRKALRGKYIFNFTTTFIRQLIEDGADIKKRTVLDRNIKYNMDNSNALSLLTSYADTPGCLNVFLSNYN